MNQYTTNRCELRLTYVIESCATTSKLKVSIRAEDVLVVSPHSRKDRLCFALHLSGTDALPVIK